MDSQGTHTNEQSRHSHKYIYIYINFWQDRSRGRCAKKQFLQIKPAALLQVCDRS